MKKLTILFITITMSFALCACDSGNTNVNSQTYNGITKTVTETTKNGKTEVKVEYTDENGKVLSEAEGKAAFEAEKDAIENSDKVTEEVQTPETTVDEQTNATEEEVEVIQANLNFQNDTDVDIVGLYFNLADESEWGENILNEDYPVLEAGTSASLSEGALRYNTEVLWNMRIITSDDSDIAFENFAIGTVENPNDVTIVITKEDDGFYIDFK